MIRVLILLLFFSFPAVAQNFGNIPPMTVLGNPDPMAKKPAKPMATSGIDARDFGLTTAVDAGPPIRAAYAAAVLAGVPLLLRPAGAVYTIRSLDPAAYNAGNNGNGPYPNTVQPGLYFGSQTGTTSNVVIDFGGITLQMAGTGCTTLPSGYGGDCTFAETVMFDNINNLTVTGQPVFLGSNSPGNGSVTEICAVGLFNLVDFNIGQMRFWDNGGAGVALCGDWLVHGRISDIWAPRVGTYLGDFAFLNDVVFDHWYGRPADATGAYAHQGGGISIILDPPNVSQNKTGIPFTSTTHFSLVNSDIAGYNTCFFISEGSYIKSSNNYYHDCSGTSTQPAAGLQIHSNDNIASGGVHPHHITSIGDYFSGNGNATSGGSDFIMGWGTAPPGALIWVTLTGGSFDAPVGGLADQISVQTAHHQNLLVTGNTGLSAGKINVSPITPQSDWIYANRDVNSGILNPPLPTGTGATHTTVNVEPYPLIARLIMGPSPGEVCTVPRGLAALCDGVNTGPNIPQSVVLNPGDGIYFNNTVPVGWTWTAFGG